MNVKDAVRHRHSCRAFLDRPVDPALIRDLLEVARYSPSGGNLQPWRIHVLSGAALGRLIETIRPKLATQPMGSRGDYDIYPVGLTDPWKARRGKCGEDMYATINVTREDRPARFAHFQRNWEAFGAPAVVFMSLHESMGPPQWSDAGMFLQTFMLLAEEAGLSTCPQEAWSAWTPEVRQAIGLPDDYDFFCGVAVGYGDPDAAINSLRTDRAEVDEFAEFLSD